MPSLGYYAMDVDISNVFETRRGKRCFNIGNYKFSEFRISKSGDACFRCTNKKCSVSVVVNGLNKIVKVTNAHNHEEYSDHTMTREIVRSTLKRSAEKDLHAKPNKLIRRELQNTRDFTAKLQHNDVKLLRRSMYESRKKHLPKLPKSSDDSRPGQQPIDVQNDRGDTKVMAF